MRKKTKRMNDCRKRNIIRFHSKSERYSEFDNSAPYAIRLHDLTWPTVTHYLLSEQYPGQNIDRIRYASSVEEAIRVAPGEYGIVRNKWDVVRDDYLITALRAKFSQHLDLEEMLYGTGRADLVYANESDSYLGIGPKGFGHNMFGRLLMAVRNQMGQPALSVKLTRQDDQDLVELEYMARKHPDNADKLIELAFKYLDHGWFDRAISTARFAVTIDLEHEEGNYIIAKSLIEMQHFEEAIETLKKLVRIDPDFPPYFRMLGGVYSELGKTILSKLYNRRAEMLDAKK